MEDHVASGNNPEFGLYTTDGLCFINTFLYVFTPYDFVHSGV